MRGQTRLAWSKLGTRRASGLPPVLSGRSRSQSTRRHSLDARNATLPQPARSRLHGGRRRDARPRHQSPVPRALGCGVLTVFSRHARCRRCGRWLRRSLRGRRDRGTGRGCDMRLTGHGAERDLILRRGRQRPLDPDPGTGRWGRESLGPVRAANERTCPASSTPSPRPDREADRRGRGRSVPWRAAGCRPSARRP